MDPLKIGHRILVYTVVLVRLKCLSTCHNPELLGKLVSAEGLTRAGWPVGISVDTL